MVTEDSVQNVVDQDGIVFLAYGGFLSQALISGMTEALEEETKENDLNLGDSNNIYTIFIELSQNMMNYSKSKYNDSKKSEGLIFVAKDDEGLYHIHSQNIISIEDKDKIEPRLKHIQTLSKDEIKKEYRELRRSGKNTHGKGGGIGFYEIAKRCMSIEFKFVKINENRFTFHFEATVNVRKDK